MTPPTLEQALAIFGTWSREPWPLMRRCELRDLRIYRDVEVRINGRLLTTHGTVKVGRNEPVVTHARGTVGSPDFELSHDGGRSWSWARPPGTKPDDGT